MNKSGIYPAGNRVLIKPDEIKEEVTPSGIVISQQVRDSHQLAQKTGVLIAVGADCFTHIVERQFDADGRPTGHLTRGYSEPFAKVGDRVAYARYTGQTFRGEDGEDYLMTNDEDITGTISDEVELSEFESRKGAKATANHEGLQ